MRRYEPAIRRAARLRLADRRLRRAFDSLDVCQSVFASFFVRAALGQFELGTPEQLLRLLVTMSQRKLIDRAREEAADCRDYRRLRDLRPGGPEPPATSPGPDEQAAARELPAANGPLLHRKPTFQGVPTMIRFCTLAVALGINSLLLADDRGREFVFGKGDAGRLPKGWTAARTGKGKGSIWTVLADDSAPSGRGYVLAQTAAGPGPLFNLCVADDTGYRDVEITVAFKAVKGDKDQGGGLVWRYQDANNYYVARMNPLEDNCRLYKVVAGKRVQLDTKEDLKVAAGTWHTLKVTMTGDRIECLLDGKKMLAARDGAIQKAGKIGLWTKADARTSFDSLRVRGQ